MKLNKILATAAVALTAAVSANAATYTTGDLILGIYDASGTVTQSLEFNLGAYTNFAAGGGHGFTLDIGSELAQVFGADWATNTNLKWGLAAQLSTAIGAAGQKFAFGLPETTSLTYLQTPAQVKGITANYAAGTTGYAGSTDAVGDGYLVNNEGTNSYAIKTYDLAGDDFGTGADIITPLNSNRTLDLYYFQSTSAGVDQNTSFTLNDNGVLQAVPEPSTYAMIAIGGLGLLRMFRRRSILKA